MLNALSISALPFGTCMSHFLGPAVAILEDTAWPAFLPLPPCGRHPELRLHLLPTDTTCRVQTHDSLGRAIEGGRMAVV